MPINLSLEKYPHEHGIEYVLMLDKMILGSVAPYGPPPADPKKRRLWRATAGGRVVGIFTGKNGRYAAVQAIRCHTRKIWGGSTDAEQKATTPDRRSA